MQAIAEQVQKLPGFLSGGGEGTPVDAFVIYDDGTLQAWADQEFGPGLVRVGSALVPLGS